MSVRYFAASLLLTRLLFGGCQRPTLTLPCVPLWDAIVGYFPPFAG
jgi:hypothetical protein